MPSKAAKVNAATVKAENTAAPREIQVGFTLAELKDAFDDVANAADWKGPIRATVGLDMLAVTLLAVEFFTATRCEIVRVSDVVAGAVEIRADGYRAGPAN